MHHLAGVAVLSLKLIQDTIISLTLLEFQAKSLLYFAWVLVLVVLRVLGHAHFFRP